MTPWAGKCLTWWGSGHTCSLLPGHKGLHACECGITLDMKPSHRPRPDPYPDEADDEFCDECETLCAEGRPCMCCWDGEVGKGGLG
jgi:hypothetical protein